MIGRRYSLVKLKRKERGKNKMKKLLCLLLVVLLLTGCTSTEVKEGLAGELLTSDKLIVGTSPDYPPFESLTTDGELEGFDIDLMNEVVKIINENNDLNLTVQFNQMSFDTIVGALQAKQIDVGVSGFTYDADRDVYFSSPYIFSQQVVVVPSDSTYTNIEEMVADGLKIGVQSGSTGEAAASDVDGIESVSLTDAGQLYAQFKTGAINGFVVDLAVANSYVAENTDAKILETALVDENMSIIIANENIELQAVIDEALKQFVTTDTYADLLVKWGLN